MAQKENTINKINNTSETNTKVEEESFSFFKSIGGFAGDIIETSKNLLTEIENIPDNIKKGYEKGLFVDPIINQTNSANPKIITTISNDNDSKEKTDLNYIPLTDQEINEEIARLHRERNFRKPIN